MDISGVSAAASSSVNIKVSEGQEDQHEKVVGKILESIEGTSPASRAGHSTGQALNVTA